MQSYLVTCLISESLFYFSRKVLSKLMVLEQKIMHPSYGGRRCYLEMKSLAKSGMTPGRQFSTQINAENHEICFIADDKGSNRVSLRRHEGKNGVTFTPVIDKSGSDIHDALKGCEFIKVTFYEDRVLITGQKQTATVIREADQNTDRQLTCITFCAGAGISADCAEQAGFKEVAGCEFNPKTGAEERYSDVYQVNHPDSVMFNIPMEKLDANDLPYADTWLCTLDCTDFSKLVAGRKQESGDCQTIHLFTHLMRLFWQKKPEERPMAVMIENVEGFKAVAGNAVKLCLEEEGFYVRMAVLNSLDFGSRTQRERFFLVGTAYEGFEFPTPTGRLTTPIATDGVMTLESLEWVPPEDNETLAYYLGREGKGMLHNHHMTVFDITKDTHVGTVTKSHWKVLPENWLKHPTENKFAQIRKEEHLKYLHGIREEYYLGDSYTQIVQCVGQGVCCHTVYAIFKQLYDFLVASIKKAAEQVKETTTEWVDLDGQFSLFAM